MPNVEAVRNRREHIEDQLREAKLEQRLCPWWRWRRRRQIANEVLYMRGLLEGLRLGGGAP